jgi:hypothetical protein
MFTVVTMMYTQHAQGDRHIWDVTADTRQYAVLCMWLGQFSFLICGGCTKVSILFFYRRLVEGTYSKRWTWLVWLAISFTIAYTIAFCIMLLVNCSPTEAYWRAFDVEYALTQSFTCLDTSAINAITGVCAVVSDVYAVALPCIITWHYAIPKRQKIALNVIFSLGLIVVVASCLRTYWLISKFSSIAYLDRSLTRYRRYRKFERRNQVSLQPLRLGPIRTASGHDVCLRPIPTSLLPPLLRWQSGLAQRPDEHTQVRHHSRTRYDCDFQYGHSARLAYGLQEKP